MFRVLKKSHSNTPRLVDTIFEFYWLKLLYVYNSKGEGLDDLLFNKFKKKLPKVLWMPEFFDQGRKNIKSLSVYFQMKGGKVIKLVWNQLIGDGN